jgi:hypothetical protein
MTVLEWLLLRKQEKSGNALSRSDTAEGRRLAQAELARRRKLRWPNPLKTIRRKQFLFESVNELLMRQCPLLKHSGSSDR